MNNIIQPRCFNHAWVPLEPQSTQPTRHSDPFYSHEPARDMRWRCAVVARGGRDIVAGGGQSCRYRAFARPSR